MSWSVLWLKHSPNKEVKGIYHYEAFQKPVSSINVKKEEFRSRTPEDAG